LEAAGDRIGTATVTATAKAIPNLASLRGEGGSCRLATDLVRDPIGKVQ
jgi:hypothetical protein